MDRGRWWLAFGYFLATLVAQGVHVHDWDGDDSVPESHGECDESRPHVAGHQVVDHGQAPASCPSCQFRGQHHLWLMATRPAPGSSLAIPIERDRTSTLPGAPLRLRCRAPPRV